MASTQHIAPDLPNSEAAHQSFSVSTTAVVLTAAVTIHRRTASVDLSVEGTDVRLSVNSNAPTAALGMLIPAGEIVRLGSGELAAARLISATGGTATVQVVQYVSP